MLVEGQSRRHQPRPASAKGSERAADNPQIVGRVSSRLTWGGRARAGTLRSAERSRTAPDETAQLAGHGERTLDLRAIPGAGSVSTLMRLSGGRGTMPPERR